MSCWATGAGVVDLTKLARYGSSKSWFVRARARNLSVCSSSLCPELALSCHASSLVFRLAAGSLPWYETAEEALAVLWSGSVVK